MKRDEEIMFTITGIIVQQFGVDAEQVTRDMTLKGDLEAAPLDYIELAIALEEEYGIELDDRHFGRFATIGDVVDHVVERTS